MGSMILKAAMAYLESHPDKVIALIDAGVSALIDHLSKKNAPAA